MAETKPASKILRVLILDESPDDTEQASTALRQGGYEPSSEGMNAFFRGLRQVAPRETLVPVFTLPYPPLR